MVRFHGRGFFAEAGHWWAHDAVDVALHRRCRSDSCPPHCSSSLDVAQLGRVTSSGPGSVSKWPVVRPSNLAVETISRCSSVWQSAWFGTRRSPVRIRPSGPFFICLFGRWCSGQHAGLWRRRHGFDSRTSNQFHGGFAPTACGLPPRTLSWLGFVGGASSAVGGWAAPILSAHRHSASERSGAPRLLKYHSPVRGWAAPTVSAHRHSASERSGALRLFKYHSPVRGWAAPIVSAHRHSASERSGVPRLLKYHSPVRGWAAPILSAHRHSASAWSGALRLFKTHSGILQLVEGSALNREAGGSTPPP